MMNVNEKMTGKPSVDRPWMRYYPEALISGLEVPKCTVNEYLKIGNTLGLCDYNPVIGNNQSTYL